MNPDKGNLPGSQPDVANLKQALEKLPQTVVDFAEIWNQLKQAFVQFTNNVITELQSTVALFPAAEPVIKALSQRCLFLSGYFGVSELKAFGESCGLSSMDDMERYVLDMYRSSIDEHFRRILADYEQREVFVGPAIAAHRRGEYALSIMSFLAQADGVCAEGLRSHLFYRSENLRKDIKTRHSQLIADRNWENIDVITPYRRMLLLPLSDLLPVGYSESARAKTAYAGLNRNLFLHGEARSSDVTEENSLKAFSLLSYVCSVSKSVAFWDDLASKAAANISMNSTVEQVSS